MRASIITPTFNSLEYIESCVANVHSQGDAVLEHIIVDGGSTDGTIEKIADLQRSHPSLHFIPGPDRGQSDALNKGIKAARGEAIGTLNVDDSYQPDTVSKACGVLANITAPAFVVANCKIIYPETSKWNVPKDLRFEALLLGYDYTQWPNNPAAYFYHKSVHDVVGYYDVMDHFTLDLDFIFRCARHVRMKYIRQHWGNFYLHPGSKTFEDFDGPVRQKALLDRFISDLTDVEKAKMLRIATAKDRIRRAKDYLKQSNILRRINDLRGVK